MHTQILEQTVLSPWSIVLFIAFMSELQGSKNTCPPHRHSNKRLHAETADSLSSSGGLCLVPDPTAECCSLILLFCSAQMPQLSKKFNLPAKHPRPKINFKGCFGSVSSALCILTKLNRTNYIRSFTLTA